MLNYFDEETFRVKAEPTPTPEQHLLAMRSKFVQLFVCSSVCLSVCVTAVTDTVMSCTRNRHRVGVVLSFYCLHAKIRFFSIKICKYSLFPSQILLIYNWSVSNNVYLRRGPTFSGTSSGFKLFAKAINSSKSTGSC